MEGTREDSIASIKDWLAKKDEKNILYISGSPGAGKSALASTIVQKLLLKQCVHFFFKRNDPYFRNPSIVWWTLAYHMGRLNHYVAKYLLTYLDENPTYLQNSTFMDHIDTLIIKALQSIPKTH
ncbi:hypothetical protein M422DRAFT_157714 [Sphaerobolus stellatus SS14]|nr:hypothetical protein M422DRAFT_157714 [Sphaerobolus stellatus SS14]